MENFTRVFENGKHFDSAKLFALRTIISFQIPKTKEIVEIHDILLKEIERLSVAVSLFSSAELSYFKWPHQTDFQALMGHIFFPIQLEYINETGVNLRKHVQDLLAISASYKNTLAQFEMKRILDMHSPSVEGEEIDESSSFQDYFGEESALLLEKYKKTDAPFYFGAFLDIGSPASRGYFKKGWIKCKIPLCGSYYFHSLKKGIARNGISTEMMKIHKGIGYMLKQMEVDPLLPNSRQTRIELYLKAGKHGIAEGYYSAGILAEADDRRTKLKTNPYSSLEYYKLAADNNILRAYGKIAEIYLKKDEIEDAIEAYKEQGGRGEETGYREAGKLYLKLGKEKKAIKYFKKADLDGYYDRKLNAPPFECEKLKQKEEYKRKRRYEFLLKISNAKDPSKRTGWILKEELYSGGEGSDGAAVICFSEKKENIIKYFCSNYRFKDDPPSHRDSEEGPPEDLFDCSQEEAVELLKSKGICLKWAFGTNFLKIEKCNIV